MEKRYQVFISSTYEDLKEERKAIIETLLNAKYIPAGMEMFLASNEEQFKYIKKIIDNCDYYVLVLGGRYGNVNPLSGKSFTEMEYDYALKQGIPILSFVHSDPENIRAEKREKDNLELFNKFRDKVLKNSKMCKMWKENVELVSNVIVSLTQIVDEFPRVGWCRGGQDITELLSQVNCLRTENDNLRSQNKKLKKKLDTNFVIENLANGDDEFEITGFVYEIEYVYDPEYGEKLPEWKNKQEMRGTSTWNDLFRAIGSDIFSPHSESSFRSSINQFFEEKFSVENFDISKGSYNIIKFQMLALNWINIIEGRMEEDTICLTESGKKQFISVITIKR